MLLFERPAHEDFDESSSSSTIYEAVEFHVDGHYELGYPKQYVLKDGAVHAMLGDGILRSRQRGS
jgi:hypothetical protein